MRYLAILAAIAFPIAFYACNSVYPVFKPETTGKKTPVVAKTPFTDGKTTSVFLAELSPSIPNRELLAQSWEGYRQRFIQDDGRVIDYEASDRSTSEGQAYAMLRAVFINDPAVFALTLNWAENNLRRQEGGKPTDSLWAWKWGPKADGNWGTIDNNFASDGDIDAITALILASRRWNRPEYLKLAKTKLEDLWKLSTVSAVGGKRYLLPGPKAAFVPNASTIHLNPSYLAPYAFRIFAQVDKERDWLSLVETSYEILEKSSQISAVGLPSDWVSLNVQTGKYQPLPPTSKIQSLYSFDAYRVWWRLALDAQWFNSSQAKAYLQTASTHLQQLWREQSRLPARIDLQGTALVDYEATSQYAMVYAGWRLVAPQLAGEVLETKLIPQYQDGIWGDISAYYTQNLAWLGLLPPEAIEGKFLQTN
ncbi:MAG: glycosyl hydrolase family 8 [Nostocaceae cyanobacterium]|nr:glycosyl hydrolase family 8 [Nostocaceae cyanobacterium]